MGIIFLIAIAVVSFLVYYMYTIGRRESQEIAISQLEGILGAKANFTNARLPYVYSFTIDGFYKGKSVLLSVVYGDPIAIRHDDGCWVTVCIKLDPDQITKYGTSIGKVTFLAILKSLVGQPLFKIHCGALESTRIFFPSSLCWPGYETIMSLIEKSIEKVRNV